MKINPYIIPGLEKIYTENTIFCNVCDIYGFDSNTVFNNNKSRKREFVEIRQVSMAAMRMFLKEENDKTKPLSFAGCATFFNKDHATAMHACKTVLSLWDTDRVFKNKVFKLFNGKRPKYDNEKPNIRMVQKRK